VFSGFYYWWPKMFGRLLDEKLGKINFWLILIGFNLTFFPMHIVGLLGMPRRTYRYDDGMGWGTLNMIETVGGFIVALGTLVFLVNMIVTARKPRNAPSDPWDGRSLEWSIPSPAPEYNFAEIPRIEARDDWWHRKYTEDSEGRLVKLPSGGAVDEADLDVVEVEKEHHIHLPSPSFYPFVVALGLPVLGYAAVFLNVWLVFPGLILVLFGIYAWGLEPGTEPEQVPAVPEDAAPPEVVHS
jgi:cytochrome c oxidase subunit 1